MSIDATRQSGFPRNIRCGIVHPILWPPPSWLATSSGDCSWIWGCGLSDCAWARPVSVALTLPRRYRLCIALNSVVSDLLRLRFNRSQYPRSCPKQGARFSASTQGTPVVGIGSFSLGPNSSHATVLLTSLFWRCLTGYRAIGCRNCDAPGSQQYRLPGAGATNSANNSTPSSPSRSSMPATRCGVVRKPRGKVHKVSQSASASK